MNGIAEPAVMESDLSFTLLCVDDEANILIALRRLLRAQGYRVLTAESGAAGLAVMAETPVDLVISDMRMAEMDGACFLEQVKARWPDTVRILLTGYADMNSTVAAVNKGGIYRYISKPWEDDEVLNIVKDALERKLLERGKARLEELAQRQNKELKELNASLESKVKARTGELRATLEALELEHGKLRKTFLTSIRVFSNLIELREGGKGAMAGSSRRVAELARRLAQHMKLGQEEVQDITFAALLHDIGKFGLPGQLLRKPFSALTSEERAEYVKHPATAQAALMALEQLNGAAKLIRSHHERYDGMGYPDRLSGLAIPLGARILALANDYEAAQQGSLTGACTAAERARACIVEGRGNRYDPTVVDAFVEMLGASATAQTQAVEMAVTTMQLENGMVLARDLMTGDGILLLAKDHVLDASLIGQIRAYETSTGGEIKKYVRAPKRR